MGNTIIHSKEGKYILIKEDGFDNTKRRTYSVKNKKSEAEIGQIGYYARWRQYVLFPEYGTVWNSECLEFVTDFLKNINSI